MLEQARAPVAASTRRAAPGDVHIADSLSGLEIEPLRSAGRIADLGSGAGLPGLVLAAALPARARRPDRVRRAASASSSREAIERMGLANASVVCERSEEWAIRGGPRGLRRRHRQGRRPARHSRGARLAAAARRRRARRLEGRPLRGSRRPSWPARRRALAMEPTEIRSVRPYPGSRDRHIHLLRKNGPTPNGLPRRPGMAAKRPFGIRTKLTRTNSMGTVYAIANQKGGVGKTTTAVNMGACVAGDGQQTLIVDLDAQCNATVALGLAEELHALVLRLPHRRGLGRGGRPARRARQPLDRPGACGSRRRRGRAAARRRL